LFERVQCDSAFPPLHFSYEIRKSKKKTIICKNAGKCVIKEKKRYGECDSMTESVRKRKVKDVSEADEPPI